MGRAIWGIILIGFGLLFFGQNFDLINSDIGYFIAKYWPVILIVIGLLVIADIFKSVVLRIITLSILIAVFIMPFIWDSSLKINEDSNQSSTVTVQKNQAKNLNVNINAGALNLDLDSDLTNDQAVEAILNSDYLTISKDEELTRDNLNVDLEIKSRRPFNIKSVNNDLNIHLTPDLTSTIDLDIGASTINADLSKLKLENFDLNTGATTVNLKIGNLVPESKILISGGASTIKIKIPKELGAQVELSGGLNSKNLDGFTKITDTLYQTDNYGSAAKKTIIKATLGAASFKVDRY